jgi:Domain of unknown function (DUF4389)
VAEPFVRVTVSDDFRRSRLTVFFRLLLAIPHFVWWVLWSIAAALAAFANWVATLVTGRPPSALHRFLTAYIRYSTHLFAYVNLAANPYPAFTPAQGYPVDVEFGEPERQRRWVTALRLFLAVPALLLAAVFEGSGFGAWSGYEGDEKSFAWGGGGVLLVAAVLGWFVSVVRGRMPFGFRDVVVYGLRYLAELASYLFVLTERYPNVDPVATPVSAQSDHPVRLTVADDLRRSRLTVFFRLLLALPHFVWFLLWSIAVFFAAFVTWIATLIAGRPPQALHRFLSAYVRYSTHLSAYVALTANPFPGFTGAAGSYPVDPELPPPDRQHRLVTGFRLFLALPALVVSGALSGLLFVSAFLGWFASLALGRMPRSLREAQAYALRYSAQVSSYVLLVTDRYAFSAPVLEAPEQLPGPEPPPGETPAVA